MFMLPNLPSPQAETHELADFAELVSWECGIASQRDIVAYLGRIEDNEYNVGCDDDDDRNSEILDEVMNEIDRRAAACDGGYPFSLNKQGTVVRFDSGREDAKSIVYKYLLLSTRLNMKSNRSHAGLDGTLLLEELGANALRNYLGPERANSLVFGTAAKGNFEDKVKLLCDTLREGSGFRNIDEGTVPRANDDKLDTVAWVPFADKLPSQLIIFCQCKTGTNWTGQVAQLQPDAFMNRWMREPILSKPIRAFCVSESADRSKWKSTCINAGLFFDRCRLVDFCNIVEAGLLERIKVWTIAAKETVTIAN